MHQAAGRICESEREIGDRHREALEYTATPDNLSKSSEMCKFSADLVGVVVGNYCYPHLHDLMNSCPTMCVRV